MTRTDAEATLRHALLMGLTQSADKTGFHRVTDLERLIADLLDHLSQRPYRAALRRWTDPWGTNEEQTETPERS